MNVHPLYLMLLAYRLFTRLVLHPSSCNISSLLEQLRISLRIHHITEGWNRTNARYRVMPVWATAALSLSPVMW